MSIEIDANLEPLPGYRLIHRLGAGGYGEVWCAEAPGGLIKAIKFVFGTQHEKRATNELRALDHVRGVRHPFLLSLERIEVVDRRLLIVSELADGSVKDRFDDCRREGLPGIPRSELLQYLHDAADALDFMSEAHALQHLDIKPENLLLLAGHVKVADFGLVKDVRQSQASLVGGMTPLYAAPEVFRGAPSRQSDQYSLAIVYEEMLTGTLPFAGSNAAELTLQHLNDEPDLTALTPADRYAVSRALSKDPAHRFTSCREFIDSMLHAASEQESSTQPFRQTWPALRTNGDHRPSLDVRTAVPTDVFDDGETDCSAEPLRLPLPAIKAAVVDLPAIELGQTASQMMPTVVIGVGGAGGRVITRLRRLVQECVGPEAKVPAIQYLLIDTDARSLSLATGGEHCALAPEDTLHLPLRRPQHYREQSQTILNWLSRRWLYNIPRSLRTEGLRPLGRLALADHARQTAQRIRRSIIEALDPEGCAITGQTLNRPRRPDAIRVYIAASISGGTGSGMALDLAYAVRAILEKNPVVDAQTIGLMLHATGGDPRQCELARVNAFSWLTEWRHFQQPDQGYPGDLSCGLPAHPAGIPAFDHTYLADLGDGLDETELEQATGSVAEYLLLNTLSPSASFFEACRRESAAAPNPASITRSRLSSFGLHRRTAAPEVICDEFTGVISQQVIAGWRKRSDSGDGAASDAALAVDQAAAQLVKRLRLDPDALGAIARALVEAQLGGDATNFFAAWMAKQIGGAQADHSTQLQVVNRIFSLPQDGADRAPSTLLGQPIATIVDPLADKLRSEIRRWISARLDDHQDRLTGAIRGLNWLREHCTAIKEELSRQQRYASEVEIGLDATSLTECVSARALAYFNRQLEQLAIAAAERIVHLLICETKALGDEIAAMGREIDQIAAMARNGVINDNAAKADMRLTSHLLSKLPALSAQVDSELQSQYIDAHGGLMALIMQGGRPRAQLHAKLRELSRRAVQLALADIPLFESATGESSERNQAELRSQLASSTPKLLDFGGTRRVLAILPRDAAVETNKQAIASALDAPVSAVAGLDNSFTVCVEAADLSLPHIALSFIERRRDRMDFAARVQCRTDIHWTPLIEDTGSAVEASAFLGADREQAEAIVPLMQTMVM